MLAVLRWGEVRTITGSNRKVIHGRKISPKMMLLESGRAYRRIEPVLLKIREQNALQPRMGEGVP
jgi:hypothetical protein